MSGFDIYHALAVATHLRETSEEEWLAAIFHDVLEDTPLTAGDLLEAGVPPEAVRLVEILTRGNETYAEYIQRVCEHPQARRVKLADLHANLARLDDEHRGLFSRYTEAIRMLEARECEARIS